MCFHSFINETAAFADGLAYITDDNVVVMKGDNTSWLAAGEVRNRSKSTNSTFCVELDALQSPVYAFPAWPNTTQVYSLLTSIKRRGAVVR